ncbi:MAG: hypothetical protein ABID54_14295 [Pseudomonadota bacterium]
MNYTDSEKVHDLLSQLNELILEDFRTYVELEGDYDTPSEGPEIIVPIAATESEKELARVCARVKGLAQQMNMIIGGINKQVTKRG